MRPLAAIERFFERLFERPGARLFRVRLQPVQLQHRIERAMEAGRMQTDGRIMVPDRYVVRLHPDDLAAFQPIAGSLATELAESALAFARRHHYAVHARPTVLLEAAPRVDRGDVDVAATSTRPVALAGGEAADRTAVFAVPEIVAPAAVLHVVGPDGSTRQVRLDGHDLSIGRAPDNGLVVDDTQVSRHHARIQVRRGALVLTDLGSTNGTYVGGVRVSEVVLGAGDRIQVGATALVVETTAG